MFSCKSAILDNRVILSMAGIMNQGSWEENLYLVVNIIFVSVLFGYRSHKGSKSEETTVNFVVVLFSPVLSCRRECLLTPPPCFHVQSIKHNLFPSHYLSILR